MDGDQLFREAALGGSGALGQFRPQPRCIGRVVIGLDGLLGCNDRRRTFRFSSSQIHVTRLASKTCRLLARPVRAGEYKSKRRGEVGNLEGQTLRQQPRVWSYLPKLKQI